MPVVINEIQITAYVSEQANAPGPAKQQQAGSAGGAGEKEKEQTIKTCVEEVLRIIKENQER